MIDGKALWAEVKANNAALAACKRHRFEPIMVTLGQKINCLECGGYMRLSDIGLYIAGYEAHGGSANDVWPGYRAQRAQPPALAGKEAE